MRCTYANDGEGVGGQLVGETLAIKVLAEGFRSVSLRRLGECTGCMNGRDAVLFGPRAHRARYRAAGPP